MKLSLSLPTKAKVFPLVKITLIICFSMVPILQIQCNNNSVSFPIESKNKNPQNSKILGAEGTLQIWTGNWTKFRLNNLVLVFASNRSKRHNVNIYTGKKYPFNVSWVYNYTNKVWNYMTETYGNFGPDPDLNIVIQRGTPGVHHMHSFTAASKSSILSRNYNILILRSNATNLSKDKEILLNNLAYFVEFASNNRLGSPSHLIWKGTTADPTVISCSAWCDIFTYDIYNKLGTGTGAKPSLADTYRSRAIEKWNNYPKKNTSWFKNWFLPIYTKDSSILQRYFTVLSTSLPSQKQGNRYNRTLNIGEFVHFWSAAGKMDLRTLANSTFGWNSTFKEQFQNARKEFQESAREYACNDCINVTIDSKPPVNGAEKNETDNLRPSLTTTAKSERDLTTNIAIIAGSLGGVFVLLLAAGLIVSVVFYKRKIQTLTVQFTQSEMRNLTDEEVHEFFEGDPNASPEDTLLVQSKPFVKEFEIPRELISLDPSKILGTGQFGSVIQGFIQHSKNDPSSGDDPIQSVAVKTVKQNVDVMYFKAFLSEVKIMAYLGCHENIVELYGTCTGNIKNREIFIALEFCSLGNLENYLRKNRNLYRSHSGCVVKANNLEKITNANIKRKSNINDATDNLKLGLFENEITTLQLIQWALDITNAMTYLTQKKIIHGDLAARNILLTENRVAKISDFGLSRQFINYENYMKTSKLPVPWRWLAIECIKQKEFSTASDAWAFGVTMWEIFSLAEIPYGCWTYDLFFVDKLIDGERLLKPINANEEIYNLMKDCWKTNPAERPKFRQIYNILRNCISDLIDSPCPSTKNV